MFTAKQLSQFHRPRFAMTILIVLQRMSLISILTHIAGQRTGHIRGVSGISAKLDCAELLTELIGERELLKVPWTV
jgi:hypothetical protein